MQTLETGKLYVKDIFGASRFYRIPEYQRPYVWGTEQVTDLLNDVSQAMDSDPSKEYFLGCMIWNLVKQNEGGYEFECQDILDGQQRFITLLLLHAVLRDLASDKRLTEKATERLLQEEDPYDNIPARHRVLFAIRKDKDFLVEHVLKAGATKDTHALQLVAKNDNHTLSVRSMASAIVDMHDWWEQRLSEIKPEDKRANYVREFFRYLSNNVLTLFLATPDNLDDAYNLFTVLNSRGLQLRAGDILRAQNLRQVEDEQQRQDLARSWDSYVDAIRPPYSSFDELLNHIMLAKIRFTSDKTRTLNAGFDYLTERGDMEKGVKFFAHLRHRSFAQQRDPGRSPTIIPTPRSSAAKSGRSTAPDGPI